MLPLLWPGEPFIPAPPAQGLIFLWSEPFPVPPPPNAMGLAFLRFSISRQGTRFSTDSNGTAFHGSSQRRIHSTDGSGNVFTDSSGNRFSGDE